MVAAIESLDLPERNVPPDGPIQAETVFTQTGDRRAAPDMASFLPTAEQHTATINAARGVEEEKLGVDTQTNDFFTARMGKRTQQMEAAHSAEVASAHSLPPEWNADKERADRIRGPFERFGDVATVFAMLASGFSRQPMTSALNAGAAAMNAVAAHDENGYEKAYTAWKDNTTLAVKRFDMQHTLFNDSEHLFNTDLRAWHAINTANAAKYDDKRKLALLQNGMYPELFKLEGEMVKNADAMRESLRAGELYNAQQQELKETYKQLDAVHGPDGAEPWDPWKLSQARSMAVQNQMVQSSAKSTTDKNVSQAQFDYFLDHGKAMPPEQVNDLIRNSRATSSRGNYQEVADLAAQLAKPVEQGGEGLPLSQAIPEAERRISAGREGGKVEARMPLEKLKVETKKELVKLNNEAKAELTQKLEEGKDRRLEISDNLKRELAKLNIDARNDIVDKLEAGRNERLNITEGGKTERATIAEENKLTRAQFTANTKKELQQLSATARQELEEYREAGRQTRSEQAETGRQNRAELSDNTRRELADLSITAKKELAEYLEAGRETRSERAATREEDRQRAITERTKLSLESRERSAAQKAEKLPNLSQIEGQQINERTKEILRDNPDMPATEARGQALGENAANKARARLGGRLDDVKTLADGIAEGALPPSLIGFREQKAPVEAQLHRQGFDLAKANMEWKAAERQVGSLNSERMIRFSSLATSVINTIDEVKSLSKQMELGGIPALNYVQLQSLIQTRGNTPQGQLAVRYVAAVNTLKEEFANLATGGYAPTESVWKLANKQINENYGTKELNSAVTEVQRLIRYRVQAVPHLDTLGPAAPNKYLPPVTSQSVDYEETKTVNGQRYGRKGKDWFTIK